MACLTIAFEIPFLIRVNAATPPNRRLNIIHSKQEVYTDVDDNMLSWDDDDAITADAHEAYHPLLIDEDDTIIERQFAALKQVRLGNYHESDHQELSHDDHEHFDENDDMLLWDDDDAIVAEARQPYQPLLIDEDDTIIERQFVEYKNLRGKALS